MNSLLSSVATLAVSTIYLLYQAYRERLRQRDQLLRERVAYLLWRVANRAG